MNIQQTQHSDTAGRPARSRRPVARRLAAAVVASLLTLTACAAQDTVARDEPMPPDHLVERGDGQRTVAEPVPPDHLVERGDGQRTVAEPVPPDHLVERGDGELTVVVPGN